jgi:hypothetical protein
MDEEIEKILESIEMEEKELFELRQMVLAVTPDDPEQMLGLISSREKIPHYVGQDRFKNQPYYYLFEAYAQAVLDKRNEAIERANRAASLFRMRNMQWNEALAHWFLGILYQRYSRKEDSCKELQNATAILEGMAQGFQRQGRVEDCLGCQAVLRQLYRHISLAKPELDLIATANKDHKSYLLPDWMPVYQQVQKDQKSILWVEPRGSITTEVQLIVIAERWYSIKSVTANDQKIKLDSAREYGWARVRGDDMNAASPTPIADGDYVLFIKHPDPQENDLVVASYCEDPVTKEYAYMVRKFGKKLRGDNTLYSESSVIGDKYRPIVADEHTQILGQVVAVAKPVEPRHIEATLEIQQSRDVPLPKMLTPDFLTRALSPYLDAIAGLQKAVCENSGRPAKEIEIKLVRGFAPLNIGVDGLLAGTQGFIRVTRRWRVDHQKEIVQLIEKETQIDLELKAKDADKRKAEIEKLYLEANALRKELSASLEKSVVPALPPGLSPEEQRAQLDRLVPQLLSIALSPLEIRNI